MSYAIYDGMLRPRQTQKAAVGGGRVVTDTLYDGHGRAEMTFGAHAEPGEPSSTLWWEPEWSVPSQGLTLYDRAGRPTNAIFRSGDGVTNIVEKWRTTTSYEGDRTTVVPPKGGTTTTSITDALGRKVELRQYTTASGVNGAYDSTKYGYNGKDQLTTVTDTAGNQWTYKYDMRGHTIESRDPDKGTTTSAYNDAGDLVRTTDARNEVLAYTYDALGRKTAVYDDAVADANKRAEWKYDRYYDGEPIKGQMTEAIRYDNGNAYKWQARRYNFRYQISGEHWIIPAVETGLAGTYVYGHGYSSYTGAPTELTYPGGGDQTTETITTTYDRTSGLPGSLETNLPTIAAYVARQQYSSYGEPTVTTMKIGGGVYAEQSFDYELDTRRIHKVRVKPETATGTVAERTYTYENAGAPLSIADTPQVGQADTQCFAYDHLQRLTSAWTPKTGVDCKAERSTANLGGPAPYWLDWTIDRIGNRTKEVSHTAAGDTARAYAVPTPGASVVRPHAVTSMTTTQPGQTTGTTVAYGYDSAGNMTTRPGPTAGQTLTWDAEGKPVKVVEGGKTTTNLYDAGGTRLIRRDADGTTLYLPGMELRRTGSGSSMSVTGTRYYSFNGATVASRTGGHQSLTWLFNDHQGTQQTAVNAYTQKVTIRRQQPYGSPRGDNPVWPNNKGFVGGDVDPTGLTHIGAREYDPVLGRFISVDPVQDLNDPQQWNAYSYSGNDPIGHSDPTGLRDDTHFYGNRGAQLKETAGAGGGGGGSGSSGTSSGGGGFIGTVQGVLRGNARLSYDSTVGVVKGIYSFAQDGINRANENAAAYQRGEMTYGDILWDQAKWTFSGPGMPGGAWNMLKGLWEEGEAAVTADTAEERADHGTYVLGAIALLFAGGKGAKLPGVKGIKTAPPRDPLLDYADSVKGKKAANGHAIKVATEMTTPSGRKIYGHNGQPNENIRGLVNDYKSATGNQRHMKCAELNCISQAVDEGLEFRGSTMRSVTVDGAFGKPHGTPMAPCERHCKAFLPWLDITANPSTFPEDW
ncbi:RHS repeat-associated core domain-containing protein [Couchioplanes caeruleus subsp. azureus]|uniref:RHS repeat-associated core domain-containing protein n=1 Tax=Couchioplanes caeruleus TaxID=56438 RepID=UPI003620CCEE